MRRTGRGKCLLKTVRARMSRPAALVLAGACALCLAADSVLAAEELSISASVRQRSVAVGSELVLTVVVTGSGLRSMPDPELPGIENAGIYSAGKSTSISTSLVNGRFTSQNSVTHNYVIVPEREGELVIGPISVTHKDRTKRTAPISITVVAAGKSFTATPRSEARDAPAAGGGGRYVFVELVTDKTQAYVSEQLILTFRFYTRVNLLRQPEYVPPTTTGFWVEPLPKQPSYETLLDGMTYLVIEVKSAVFPTRSGTLTIEPATLRCVIEEPDRSSSADPFDRFRRGFFGLGSRGREISLRSDPVEIEVLPIPEEGVPGSFGGAVGAYEMRMEADRTRVKQGDPITLTITISGRGNVNTVSAPVFPDLPGMRSYDSGSQVHSAGSASGLSGEKVFERVVVPEVSGAFSVGPVEFSYFDPAEGRFRTLAAGPIEVSVAPGPVSIGPEPELPEKHEVRVLSRDILHIHTGRPDLRPAAHPLHRSTWFLLLQLAPLVAYIAALGYRRHTERLSADVGYARLKRADRMARRRLSTAREHLNDPDALGFYSALEKATRDFVGDKFNLAATGMTYDGMEKDLQSRGVPYSLIQELSEVLQECDRARFCPAEAGSAARKISLKKAEGVIARLGKCKT